MSTKGTTDSSARIERRAAKPPTETFRKIQNAAEPRAALSKQRDDFVATLLTLDKTVRLTKAISIEWWVDRLSTCRAKIKFISSRIDSWENVESDWRGVGDATSYLETVLGETEEQLRTAQNKPPP